MSQKNDEWDDALSELMGALGAANQNELLAFLQDQQRRLEHLVRLQRRSMRLLWAMMAIQVAQVVMWAVKLIGT